ncbi:MAG: ABC transporter permease subunit [Anaerolineales bacterium]|nr:ABC transporter permease subunit [Anaerolineales bacterium]
MRYRILLAIVRKDVMVALRNKGVLIPIIIVPLVFFVGLPLLFALLPSALQNMPGDPFADFRTMLEQMPGGLREQLSGLNEVQTVIVLALVYFFAPMFLILPLMVANVIAADSFAGEKERKTLEALLHTPATDLELYLGKLLAAWAPAVAVSLVGFVLYGLVANIAAWPVMGRVFFPNTMWIVLVLWVAPAAAALGMAAMVLVSSRAQGFQDAYQIGGAVVLPVLLLVIGQMTGVMYFSTGLVALLGLVLWVLDGVMLWFGVRTFQRGELIARL